MEQFDERFPSRRVMDLVIDKIDDGTLTPGDEVGTIASLSQRAGVSLGAARVGLKALVDGGWLVARPREGHFVAVHPPPRGVTRPSTSLNNSRIAALEDRVLLLEEEVRTLVRNRL